MNKIITLLIAIMFMAACANNKTDSELSGYRAEAKNLCKSYSIDYWKEIGIYDIDSTKKAEAISDVISSSVSSPEMKAILNRGGTTEPEKYYSYLQEEISILTKEPFDCLNIQEFYTFEKING